MNHHSLPVPGAAALRLVFPRVFCGVLRAGCGLWLTGAAVTAKPPESPNGNPHDLSLPAWGPYTKRYMGISHVAPANTGLRFDLSVFPGLFRRKANPPNVMFESGYYPWEATTDLSYFSIRHELEWKDQVYTDISYSAVSDHCRLIRAECVNNSDQPQNLVLHLVASMNFPTLKSNGAEHPIQTASVTLPPGAVWVGALAYKTIRYAKATPADHLVYDGKLRGEIRGDGFVTGSALGMGFGATADDTATYQFAVEKAMTDARVIVRYRMAQGGKSTLRLPGLASKAIELSGTGGLKTELASIADLTAGSHELTVVADGGTAIELDGFALVTAADADKVVFEPKICDPKPQLIPGPNPNCLVLKYQAGDDYYGLSWSFEPSEVRQYFCKDLDLFFPTMVQNHADHILRGEGDGHFTDIFLRPIPLVAHTRRIIHATVCNGTRAEVDRQLAAPGLSDSAAEAVHAAARARLPDLKPAPQGAAFEFSQRRMAATLLTNVVYPIHTAGGYIKHNTPGRWWDSLYTWDSGFIGLGLAELDPKRAEECLNAYLTEPGAQSAFIHHGSMVPVQFYLFLDLWNRTQSQALLDHAYPRLRQYYEFYVGRLGGSTTGKFRSGVLSSFDYFYNSGGWDDYPAQKFTHEQKLGPAMAPVITTAHAIRIAKIMLMAAEALGRTAEVAGYRQDIAALTEALQQHCWDEESGYFGYLQHDTNGQAIGILRTESGSNRNMGMDGVYPLVAGIGTAGQRQKMLANLQSPEHLWSRIGLSAVDQSAPYFRNDGYWNGTVWMPHQWFFWKSMLDLGESEFAWQIAKRGLEVWSHETDESYHCMEHFLIETGRGAGWHEFGALSAPVLKWYCAYCRPGTLTTGFNVRVARQQFNNDATGLAADLILFHTANTAAHASLVVCLNPSRTYQVRWNGELIAHRETANGLLDIGIPSRDGPGKLVVCAAGFR